MATAPPSAATTVVAPARSAGSDRRRCDELADEAAELAVPARLVPGERAAAVRIVAAGQPDLVAVVDARRAGQRQLEQRREADPVAVAAEDRRAAAACRGSRGG